MARARDCRHSPVFVFLISPDLSSYANVCLESLMLYVIVLGVFGFACFLLCWSALGLPCWRWGGEPGPLDRSSSSPCLDQNKCVRSKQAHSVQVNRILKDSSPLMKNTLLMFPPGVMCSADFTMSAIPTEGDKVKIYQQTVTATCGLGRSDQESSQVFVPSD